MNCNNCDGSFDAVISPDMKDNGIIIRQGNDVVAAVCNRCTKDVTLVKVTVRRADGGGFAYEQYQPLEAGRRFGG